MLYLNYDVNDRQQCKYSKDGVSWNSIGLAGSHTSEDNICVINYIDGNYFGYSYDSTNLYRMYYSPNGVSNWQELPRIRIDNAKEN